MLSPQELFWLYLNNIKNIGARRFAKLYFKYRTKEAFLEGIERGDQELIFLSAEILTEIKNGAWKAPCDRMINYMVEHAINAVFYSSPEYPPQLREIERLRRFYIISGIFLSYRSPALRSLGRAEQPVTAGNVRKSFPEHWRKTGFVLFPVWPTALMDIPMRLRLPAAGKQLPYWAAVLILFIRRPM